MNNDDALAKLQLIGDVLSNKFKCLFQGTFRSSNPVYSLPKPITLPRNRNFEAALIYFASDNYLVNVHEHNNKFRFHIGKEVKQMTIPTGAYELEDINNLIKSWTQNAISIGVKLNTFESIIEISNADYKVDFTADPANGQKDNTIRSLLGFNAVLVQGKGKHNSQNTIQITSTKSINVHCSLISNSYDSKGIESDIIYSFPAYKVGIGYKINESPNTPFYLPVNQDVIKDIRFRMTDNNGNELNFKNEECAFCIYLSQV